MSNLSSYLEFRHLTPETRVCPQAEVVRFEGCTVDLDANPDAFEDPRVRDVVERVLSDTENHPVVMEGRRPLSVNDEHRLAA